MIERRRFVLTSLAGVVAEPLAAEAQPAARVPQVGVLRAGSPPDPLSRLIMTRDPADCLWGGRR
jgi:hypothetical protein